LAPHLLGPALISAFPLKPEKDKENVDVDPLPKRYLRKPMNAAINELNEMILDISKQNYFYF